ncbi:phage tail protein [Lysinibacillus capsici]|uniref:phage tail-collar fiber domain-containing protein n=1 Tax=Lysinibacillus capsici TaxID=2115968 RepID=UPI0028BE4DB2|nr:phage tail protein [Lysinibacillus capsici]WNN77785.1 phage tail protein [Lysinibacillus capsici]
MAQYGTIITNIGLAQIANAQITQTKVGLEYIALGDGNGAHYVPKQNQTALIHEVWRGPIAELSIDPTNSNRIIIDAVIPVTAGGFTIREIGIFDDKNNLIAVGQYPEKYKPQLSEGVSEETLIHFVIETNNADVVKLTIDPTVIIASRNYVDGKVGQVQTALTEHSADNNIHVTAAKQTKWNSVSNDVLSGGRLSSAGKPLTDWNLAVDNGYYTSVTTTLNSPVANYCSGIVEVFNVNFLKQTIRQVDQLVNRVFTRVRQSGVWGEWVELNALPAPTSAVLATGWSNSYDYNMLRYYKDSFGIVHVTGRVKRADGNSTRLITTLPVGYRPLAQQECPVTVNMVNSGYVDVQTNGNIEVWLEGTTNVSVMLDISFPTTIV